MDLRWLSSILLGASCLAFGYLLGTRRLSPFHLRPRKSPPIVDGLEKGSRKKGKKGKVPLEIEKLADILDDFKMVLVVRNDLKMGKRKIAAQCRLTDAYLISSSLNNHATLGLYKKLLKGAPKALERWETCGQPKVVLKIETKEEMLALQEKAKGFKLPTHITIDAGRTQIAPNSRTVMAILGPVEVVDDVTGELKLM